MRIHYKTPATLRQTVAHRFSPPRSMHDERRMWAWYTGDIALPRATPPLGLFDRGAFEARRGRAAEIGTAIHTEIERAASSTITVGSQVHDELAGVTPLTPEREAAIERVLGDMPRAELDGVRHQAGVHAALARMAQLSDKTMREIREHSDRIIAEREAAAERVARRVERVADVVFVTLLAIGFLIWAVTL